MSFETVAKKTMGKEKNINRVAFSFMGKVVRVSLSEDVYKRFGSPASVRLAVGKGADSGKIMLIPAAAGDGWKFSGQPRMKGRGQVGASIGCNRLKIKPSTNSNGTKTFSAEFTETPKGLIVKIPPALLA